MTASTMPLAAVHALHLSPSTLPGTRHPRNTRLHPMQVYRYLEPLYNDLRKLRELNQDGSYSLAHVDRLAESMLYQDYLFDIALPRLPKRIELETQVRHVCRCMHADRTAPVATHGQSHSACSAGTLRAPQSLQQVGAASAKRYSRLLRREHRSTPDKAE